MGCWVVVPARQTTWLDDNPMPELTLSHSQGSMNSVTVGFRCNLYFTSPTPLPQAPSITAKMSIFPTSLFSLCGRYRLANVSSVEHNPTNKYERGFLSVADPDPGLGTFLTPGSGIWDRRKSASGIRIRDEQPGSYFLELRNHSVAFFYG
jgi:hypothetical protein